MKFPTRSIRVPAKSATLWRRGDPGLPLPLTDTSAGHRLDFCDRKPNKVVLNSDRSNIRLCSPCGLKIPDNLSTVVDAVRAGTNRARDEYWIECASHV